MHKQFFEIYDYNFRNVTLEGGAFPRLLDPSIPNDAVVKVVMVTASTYEDAREKAIDLFLELGKGVSHVIAHDDGEGYSGNYDLHNTPYHLVLAIPPERN